MSPRESLREGYIVLWGLKPVFTFCIRLYLTTLLVLNIMIQCDMGHDLVSKAFTGIRGIVKGQDGVQEKQQDNAILNKKCLIKILIIIIKNDDLNKSIYI